MIETSANWTAIEQMQINGDQVGGEHGYIDDGHANNGAEYNFYYYFDQRYTKEEVQSVRVEFGTFGK